MTTEKLASALDAKNVPYNHNTLQKLCDEYQSFCSKCSNPNTLSIQKYDCGCGGNGSGKMPTKPRMNL